MTNRIKAPTAEEFESFPTEAKIEYLAARSLAEQVRVSGQEPYIIVPQFVYDAIDVESWEEHMGFRIYSGSPLPIPE